jgi:hypothetical protein
MRPFRNSGWDYLTQMESIIPVSSPKGHHTFAASSAWMMTNQSDDGEEKDLPDAIKAAGSNQAGAVVSAMHIDQFPIKTSVSSSSKRRHSLINIDTHLLLSSHAKSAPTTIASSEPTSKKHSSSKGKQLAGSSAAYKSNSAATRATKVTQNTILHGMQGTMNRVTNIFERSVAQPTDLQAGARDEALDFLQTCEEGLSVADQKKLVILFMKDAVVAQTYSRLVNEDLRWSWIAEMLETERLLSADGLLHVRTLIL